jgi:predicted ATPase
MINRERREGIFIPFSPGIYLKELSIENFRGFIDPQTIEFAVPSGRSGSGLTIFVGPNNVGKSTVIEALRVVVSPREMMDRKERHFERPVRISIKDSHDQTKSITNPGLGATIKSIGNAYPGSSYPQGLLRYVPSRRAWSARTGALNVDPQSYWSQRVSQNRSEDDNLVARLGSFSAEEKTVFQSALSELIPQIRNWRIEYSDGFSYLEYTTLNGSQHTADLFGDGVASLFRIALALYDSNVQSCVVIDEPELSLHPQGQKRLANFISNKAAQRQILLCTHSPYFVNWTDLSNGAIVYRLHQKRNGIEPKRLTNEALDGLRRLYEDWEKPQLLDPVAREVFFADEVVFFEGQEDVGIIRRFTEQESIPSIETFGYGVGGAGNVKYFLKMALDLGIPTCAVFDGSSRREWDDARNMFPGAMITLLPTEDIRDKPPSPGRSARDGMFRRDGAIKLQHKDYLLGLIAEIRSYLNDQAAP